MQLHHEEGDRSSLEPLSFGITSGIPSYQSSLDLNPVWIQWNCTRKKVTDPVWNQSSLDPMQVHHKGDDKSSLDPMELHHKEGDRSSLEPLSFGITSDSPSY